jgi:hypothetical protein
MARGWESKSVEDQIAARLDARNDGRAASAPADRPSPEDAGRRTKREGLLLSRARMTAALGAAGNPQYRAMLESAIAHLDSQLKE